MDLSLWAELTHIQKINWLHSVILLYFNSVGTLEQVFIVSHSYQTYLSFPGLDLNLDCELRDHVIMRFASSKV
jgi:hypothetical protein